MAKGRTLAGIVVEIGGDTSKLSKALGDINAETKSLERELRGVNTLLKYDPKNVELTAQKQKVLNELLGETKKKLEILEEAQKQAQAQFDKGEITEQQFRDLNREIEQSKRQLKDYGKEIESLSSPLARFGEAMTVAGEKMVDMGKTMTLKATTPIVAGFTLAAKSAMDFESAFAGVEKTVDGTTEQIAALERGIRDMALEIPASTTEIAGVAEAAGQLGIETDNVLEFTRVMIDLGEATNLSAETAATSLARFANVTNMSQRDFDRAGSSIVALGNNFATTEAEIVSMAMNLGSAGTQIGMSQAEIFALSTALSSVGLEAAAGGTAFSKLMVEIQVATETGGEALNDFASVAGMTSAEFTQAFEQDAVGAIMAFVGGLNDTERNGMSAIAVLDEMGIKETRLRDTILRAAGATDVFTDAIETSNTAWDENSALTEEAAVRYQTTESQMAILKNTANEVAISFGELLLPILIDIMEGIKGMLEWVNNLSPEMKDIVVKVGLIVAAIGPLLIIGGKIATGIGALIKLFGILKPVVMAIGAVIGGLTWPVVAVIAAVVALIAIFTDFGGITTWLKGLWDSFANWIGNLFGNMFNAIGGFVGNIVDSIVNGFKAAVDFAVNIFQTMWTFVSETFGSMFNFIGSIVELIYTVIVGWLTLLWTFWSTIFNTIFEIVSIIFTAIWEFIVGIFEPIIETVVTALTTIAEFFSNIFTSIYEFVSEVWTNIKTFIAEIVMNIVTTVSEWFTNLWTSVSEIFTNIWTSVSEIFTNLWNSVTTIAGNIIDSILAPFRAAIETVGNVWNNIKEAIMTAIDIDLWQVGADIINGLINGFKSMIGAVGDAIGNIGNSIVGGFKSFFGIKSPSRLMRDVVGKMIPQGIAVGVEADTDKALDAVDDLNATLLAETNESDIMGLMDGNSSFTQSRGLQNVSDKFSTGGGLGAKLDEVLNKIDTFMGIVENSEDVIVLDDGTLVGKITDKMDNSLGQKKKRTERGG